MSLENFGLENNITKMSIICKATNKINVIPIKIPMTFFYRNRKVHSEIHMNHKGSQKPKQS